MKSIKIGTKVRTTSTWFRPAHDCLCTVAALPNKRSPMYRLESTAFLNGFVYRTREEFTPVE